MSRFLTTIPFAGFYCSLHDAEIDDTLEQMFADWDTGTKVNYDLVSRAHDSMQWRNVHEDYAKEYAEGFAKAMELELEFESLKSPREYNFETDTIYAYITEASLRKAFAEVNRNTLIAVADARHSSRPGFISFYDHNIVNWGADPTRWDHNQIGTLMCAVAQEYANADWDEFQELDLMDCPRGNGFLDNLLWEHCKDMPRLTKVHEYLEAREKRAELALN